MKAKNSLLSLVCSVPLWGLGCTVQQSLGDLPADGGMGGEGANSSGGSVSGSSAGGSGNTSGTGSDAVGGSGNVSGTGSNAVGGSGNTSGTGSDAVGGSGNVGSAGMPDGEGGEGASSGTGSSGSAGTGQGGSGACFHPDQDPYLGFPDPNDPNGIPGCPCDEEDAGACVLDDRDAVIRLVSLVCSEGRWQQVEDGPCYPQGSGGAACVVDNHYYYSGSDQSIGDPFSCNSCGCDNGNLNCTEIGCSEPCPEGTVAGERCLDCGPTDACTVVETGCFPACSSDDECERGCSQQGFCLVMGCP